MIWSIPCAKIVLSTRTEMHHGVREEVPLRTV
jgi:hypothetical protein